MPLTVKVGETLGRFGIWKWPTKLPAIALTLLVASRRYSKYPKPWPCRVSSWIGPLGVAGEMPMLFWR